MKEFGMTPKTLIPVDESETTRQTIQAVIANQELLSREIILLHVVDVQLIQRLLPDMQKQMVYESAEKSGNRILMGLAKPFQEAGFKPKLLLELGTPEKAIMKVVEEQNIQLVIIGRHSGGGKLHDVLFGSVANHIVHSVKCPVLLF
jgi:nucleotide-binding universal stress UspA family protein